MTSKKKLQNFLHDNGFRCMNQWKISEGEYFTIFQKITDNEIASVLIKDYRDEQGFEVFVNASGSPQIDKDMQAIEERFGLKESLRDSQ